MVSGGFGFSVCGGFFVRSLKWKQLWHLEIFIIEKPVSSKCIFCSSSISHFSFWPSWSYLMAIIYINWFSDISYVWDTVTHDYKILLSLLYICSSVHLWLSVMYFWNFWVVSHWHWQLGVNFALCDSKQNCKQLSLQSVLNVGRKYGMVRLL